MSSILQNISWKVVVSLSVVFIAIFFTLPVIDMMINGKEEPDMWPRSKINLGLDLQGGMHLVLEVQTEKAVEGQIERISQELRSGLRSKQIRHRGIDTVNGTVIKVKVKDKYIDKFKAFINDEYRGMRLNEDKEDDLTVFSIDYIDRDAAEIKRLATEQALETIRNRIDQFGVGEPEIRVQGNRRILVQLPGISDTKRAKELIGKTALLEFKLVDEINSLQEALRGNIPSGSEILYEERYDPETKQTTKQPYLIKKKTSLTGADLTDARVQMDAQNNTFYVSIRFNKKGGKVFARITGENVNKRLAIVLDNKVYSAPNIESKITGGSAIITGRFSDAEAHDLAIVLRAGALPAPVKIIEERTVGPSLGRDSIRMGLMSMCIGGILVIFFMVFYYRGAGLIADLALIINLFLIAGTLAAIPVLIPGVRATLTLPGIAGIILTIGMAVDANVLIFERIKEELQLGKTPRAAVSAGFDRATWTILDANITTFLVAFVLFQFGTGPVKGFAVTLSIGILASLFTALVFSRIIFDYFLVQKQVKTLSIGESMHFIKPGSSIGFIGKRKIAFCVSATVILVGIISLTMNQGPKLGVDFSGGTSIRIQFQNSVKIEDIKDGLKEIEIKSASVQQYGDSSENEYLIRTSNTVATDKNFTDKLIQALKTATHHASEIRQVEMVGPQVGEDLRKKALLSMFYAILLIVIYISGRFELKWMLSFVMAAALFIPVYFLSSFNISIPLMIAAALIVAILLCRFLELRYAMGAIIALIHDVFITVGIFSVFNKEFTLPIIAALLTIIGYSLNDTIVVFDRIRENLKNHGKNSLEQNINKSINETLNRTIMTSVTTLIVVVALFLLGGSTIHDFAFAMIVGVMVGTYSSIFVASPILIAWERKTS